MSRALSISDLTMSASVKRMNAHLLGPAPAPRAGGTPASTSTSPDPKRIRQRAGDGMNAWEREYRAALLADFPGSSIHREVALPLANGLSYKVDFLVGRPERAPLGYEVKGLARAAGIAKLKMAATVYPWIQFYLVTKKRKRDGGGWAVERVLP